MSTSPFRLATAQLDAPTDPRDTDAIHLAGQVVRRLMSEASARGAHMIHFGEGTLCNPDKHVLSSDPDAMAAADWSRFDWDAQRQELEAIASHAATLHLWTVLGAVHRLSDPHRPHNSLYVIDADGHVATRYDERMLSSTKISYMYTPGAGPVGFDVDGLRFGCALGMESVYPELFADYERDGVHCVLLFADYERDGVHCVLLSTMDRGATFGLQARAHASTNSYWVSYATHAADAAQAPSGVADPDGQWVAQCPAQVSPAVVTVDIDREHERLARPWRRTARAGRYTDALVPDDARAGRTSF